LHAAQKFERLLELHRRPDGARWGGANLRKGRIESRLRKDERDSQGYVLAARGGYDGHERHVT
jgi:hypothetical protein